jgi:glycosyltransferase involved in cell wall biosynthesis
MISLRMISVIIPTFNEEKNIERILKSLKRQTVKNVELIVVDDGSTDSTVNLAKKHTSKVYPRKHAERSVQRNFGASKAKGQYLLFLDADMELTPKVLESCLDNIEAFKALIIPEKTVGTGFMSTIRKFEREMYMGDKTIEVARFFNKKVFKEVKGYDENLTGAEDYDLPKRIIDKYGEDSVGWATEWILHHETQLTLPLQLKKKFYYAGKSASYAKKHPDLVSTQGNMLFRKAYVRSWRKFIQQPFVGMAFIFVRVLEASAAVLGYIKVVGVGEFIKTFIGMFKKK